MPAPPRPTPADWKALTAAAQDVARSAYAPYSNFRVGAAGLINSTNSWRIEVGCNVENTSYGLTLCAECGLVSRLHASGGGTLVAAAIVGPDGTHIPPCGRCRQLLYENNPGCLLATEAEPVTIAALLPNAFDL